MPMQGTRMRSHLSALTQGVENLRDNVGLYRNRVNCHAQDAIARRTAISHTVPRNWPSLDADILKTSLRYGSIAFWTDCHDSPPIMRVQRTTIGCHGGSEWW